ncbi:MAG: response regulator [Opitutae bacterium]|jgi:CheY-like chemotaxis protein|nr:response regulator [Opitutae bacterium]MBT7740224.1 response regulator [Opitutae bacterium]
MIRAAEYEAGDVVLPEGELGKGFCILESGTLEVVRDGRTLTEIDTAGSIFGELSEILSMKRDATIRAKTPAKVRHVEESIADIVTKNPKVSIKLIRTLGRRLFRMNRLVATGLPADKQEQSEASASGVSLLVVDDQPAIIDQLSEIAERNEWSVQGAGSEVEALSICERFAFTAIIISMALPDDSAVDLRRKLKTNSNVMNTPVIGMIVKGDEAAQTKAIDAGFAECLNKPFDRNKTEATLYEVMQLDSSARYFKQIEDFLFFKLPEVLSNFVINDIKENLDARIRGTINAGIQKMVIDVSELEEVGEEAVEVVGEFAEKIEELKLPMRGVIVAVGEEAEMWNNLDGAEEWGICETLDEAKEFLAQDPEEEEAEEE